MVEEGAGIIDIGAESTRPGAVETSAEEELARAIPVLRKLAGKVAVPLSIDTRKAAVARAAVAEGASIINDISALRHDPAMVETAIETGAAVVAMHMQGRPETMQREPRYDDAVGEIYAWFAERTAALIRAGIDPSAIIIDPGIGFGKRLEDNVRVIGEIGDFHGLGFPVMAGYSRKSFIGNITGRDAAGRLPGGFAALARCLDAGVQIIRVHDVAETVDFIKVRQAIAQGGPHA